MSLEDPIEEAKRIIRIADERKIALRLFGGIAFYFRCQSAKNGNLSRNYVDVDFMGHANQSREIKQFFQELGYVPRDRFNAMQGYRRLIFNDIEHQRRVDIFLDVFEMCHKFNFRDRLQNDSETLTLADLLATKLQIVEINEKDLKDILSMFIDHDIGGTDAPELVNGVYLANLCGDDWGIYKTFTINLEKIIRTLDGYDMEEGQKRLVRFRVEKLKKMIEDVPKSFKWKMRAKVGEKIRWYDLPEADQEVIDSRIVSGSSTQQA
ncbi:MAG: hypothetical protein HYZ12_06365 [Thaumarchaeota archaeon]|nr:hypothetical protein [Nitrososphaerota archaeon]